MASTELTEFVRESLARGMSKAQVEDALLRAGWGRDLVDMALAGYADVGFPIPVPRPRSYLSAREAFLYLLLFSTLYISAYNAGVIVFHYINRWFPDAAVRSYMPYARQAVRWALSSLVVAFPVFVYLSSIVERSVRREPAKRRSDVRRWLMYLTVFIASSVLIGDFITLVYNALGGELTTRFVLKVLAIAIIAGTVLSYYLADLRLEDTESPTEGARLKHAVTGFAGVSVAALVVAALIMIGAPSEERARRIDENRVEDLQSISQGVIVYFERHRRLPSSLDELSRETGVDISQLDPGGGPYEFRITGSAAYELCAQFEHESTEHRGAQFWSHDAGRQCFQLAVPKATSVPGVDETK